MAKLFSATTDWLHVAAAVVNTPPFSMHVWAKHAALGAVENIMVLGDSSTGNNRYYLDKTADDQSHAIERDAANSSQANSSNINDLLWHAYTGVFTNHSLRTISLDGGNTGNTATTRTTANATDLWLARSPGGTTTNFAGKLAYAAIWNRALTAAEISLLALETPLIAAPSGLVAYYILLNNALDTAGANNLTVNGSAGYDTDMPTLGQILPGGAGLIAIGHNPVSIQKILKQGAGLGALIAQGYAPTILSNFLTVTPGVGLITGLGQIPVAFRAVGPSGAPDVGALSAVGLAPTLLKNLIVVPDVFTGDADESGLAPLVLTGWYVTPAPAVVTIGGLQPTEILAGSLTVTPSAPASASVAGLAPTLSLPVGSSGVALALDNPISAAGLAPTLLSSLTVTPGVGAIDIEGFAPDTNTDFNWHDAPAASSRSWHSP